MTTSPEIAAFFDPRTSTVSYVVSDPDTGRCAVVDPVLDFDAASGRTDTASADRLIAHIEEHGLRLEWILETHVHADHMSAAPYMKQRLGGRTGIGSRIAEVQATFAALYNLNDLACDGSQFDRLFGGNDTFAIGGMDARVMHTPGHTPACVTYVVEDAAFVGDTLFMPDFGTARCDFPGGDARTLFDSIQRILSLPDGTRLFTGHDYGPGGRDYAWESTVAEQKRANIHVGNGADADAFVLQRTTRDAQLNVPALLLPAIQVNIRAGQLPAPESNGTAYLKLPLNAL